MKKWLILSCSLVFSACQQQGVILNPISAASYHQLSAIRQDAAPLTAKWAEDEAQRMAKQWSPNAALTHVLGTAITSKGEPHASYGSWTFTFIDNVQAKQAIQIVFRVKSIPVVKQISLQQLPQTEPLEIRAWGLDSDRAVLKAKQVNPNVSFKYMELTAVDGGYLVWAFDKKPLLDAMHGKPYQPLRR